MSTKKTNTLFSGVPTKIETDALMGLLDGKPEGTLIPWNDIEKTMGTSRRSERGGSVLAAWKKRAFREVNIYLASVTGSGYRIADPAERVMASASLAVHGRRRIMRAATVAASTETRLLTEEQKRTREHLMNIPARLRLAELTAPKMIT